MASSTVCDVTTLAAMSARLLTHQLRSTTYLSRLRCRVRGNLHYGSEKNIRHFVDSALDVVNDKSNSL